MIPLPIAFFTTSSIMTRCHASLKLGFVCFFCGKRYAREVIGDLVRGLPTSDEHRSFGKFLARL